MKEFMKTHQVYLTPLTPIHIGCGEDFEPTNYVIDEGVLYHFEPSKLELSDSQIQQLLSYANKSDLLSIQKFFQQNAKSVVGCANYFSSAAVGIEQDWKNKIGRVVNRESDGNNVIAKLSIERTAYLPYQNQPYVTGSGFKGALVTAYLDDCHKKQGNPKVNGRDSKKIFTFYAGDFKTSKFKGVKFGDFLPENNVNTKVYYALNFKKVPNNKGGQGRGIPLRRECILPAQYRAFKSNVTLWQDEKVFPINHYFELLRNYNFSIFVKEMKLLLERGLIDRTWLASVFNLVNNENACLIRLGKNGADSKIYQGDNVASIKIMQGKGKKPIFKDRATTVWLSGERQNQENNLLPFGWALLEVDPQSDNNALKEWCNQNKVSGVNLDEIYQNQKQAQERIKLIEQERQQKLAEEQQALKEEQERLASLSENQRLIEQKLQAWEDPQYEVKNYTDNSQIFVEAQALVKQAISENWEQSDKDFLLAIFDHTDRQSVFNRKVGGLDLSKGAGKLKGKAKEFKQLLNQLKGL
ncbi:CRISPR type III-A/MTUBE-associated RAMP protein Csm5 [Phocoenobacter uteri]|uniref:CRISPR system Cms protein Csm5 n=1 Tax=Phocoenobacter uteri TaxID=146806 RepID=A0A379C7V7_9PAST|nr:RAMP superfamily CRISPR-associated protein [Phocoenobacter uteri]MDG6882237.1 hypothetical protein [Phocoenobacter uteri]SUB58390.1 CRISPR type III-A/MTUBE-associated RAMP protein Csm5 [Phocoenobacter uteri]